MAVTMFCIVTIQVMCHVYMYTCTLCLLVQVYLNEELRKDMLCILCIPQEVGTLHALYMYCTNHNVTTIRITKLCSLYISAVVEDRFLCRHVGSNFIPTATIVDKTMVRKLNTVMFQPKSKLRVT